MRGPDFYDRKWRRRSPVAGIPPTLRALQILAYLRRHGPAEIRPRIVDLGCGPGRLSRRLARLGPVTGIDFSPETVERNRRLHPGLRFLCADLAAPGLAADVGRFPVAVCSEVAEHVERRRRGPFFANLAEVVEPGGLLILSTPCWDHLRRLQRPGESEAAFRRRLDDQPVNEYFTRRELLDTLEADFEILEETTVVPAVRSRPLDLAWKGLFLLTGYRLVNSLARRLSVPGLYRVVACRRRRSSGGGSAS